MYGGMEFADWGTTPDKDNSTVLLRAITKNLNTICMYYTQQTQFPPLFS